MSSKVLITSALPYANGPLHFGHIAGAYLPADVYARFCRLKGADTLFICGSDEYGVAITLAAEKAGRTPQEHVDIFHAINRDFFETLGISFDHYSRTTNPYHEKLVQQFFLDLYDQKFIEPHTTEQLYSTKQHRFLADRYVEGTCPKCGYLEARGDECPKCGHAYEAHELKNPKSKLSGDPLVLKQTQHWFLRYDLFKERLKEWIEAKDWKAGVIHFAKNYIDDLKMRAVTRDLDWGIKVPLTEADGKVFYVWFDAPIGYLSATQEYAALKNDPGLFEKFWCDSSTQLVQFVGKDNIPFHAVFFPAMLMGQKTAYKLVDELPANEFYMLEGRQFSKSEGWTIDLDAFFKKYSVDQIRYMIAASAPESQDSEFTWKEFQMRCNSELLGKLGNFIHRVLTFTHQYLGGVVPNKALRAEDKAHIQKMHELLDQGYEAFEQFSLRRATSVLMEMAQSCNSYFDHQKPWALRKNPAELSTLEALIYTCLESIRLMTLICLPLIPQTAAKILDFLRLKPSTWAHFAKQSLSVGHALKVPTLLFRKIEDEEIAAEVAQLKKLKEPSMATHITLDEFKKLDIVTAQVIQVEEIEGSLKLYKLIVDDGVTKRQIVSGLKEVITPEELLNTHVLVLRNLPKATIHGTESDGMILALKEGKHLKALTLQPFKLGAKLC